MEHDFSTVTELPGSKASKEQYDRLCHRYHFASNFCEGKDILEAACGAGIGLGYLAKKARMVVGGDIDPDILRFAKEHYKNDNKIDIGLFDADEMPFSNNSFDIIILYEAIYYLKDPKKFIEEAFRILKKKGMLIICTVNNNWADFNPSPLSNRYFSAFELYSLMKIRFADIQIYGAFSVKANNVKGRAISILKRAAVKLHLMPKTMNGKEFFKRIFFGRLLELPHELTYNAGRQIDVKDLDAASLNTDYKVLYAVACKK